MNNTDKILDYTKEWKTDDIADTLYEENTETLFLPIPIQKNTTKNFQAFCLLIIKPDESLNLPKGVFHIGFVHTPVDMQTMNTEYKTWSELEFETNVQFRKMINLDCPTLNNSTDSAIITVQGRPVLIDILDLCQDIADSISIGGHQPLSARDVFKIHFTHKSTDFPAPAGIQQKPN